MEYRFVIFLVFIGGIVCQQTQPIDKPFLLWQSKQNQEYSPEGTMCETEEKAIELLGDNLNENCALSSPFQYDEGVGLFANGSRIYYETVCRTFDDTIKPCLENRTKICSDKIRTTVDDWITEYRGRVCRAGTSEVVPEIIKLLKYAESLNASHFESQVSLIKNELNQNILVCLPEDLFPDDGQQTLEYLDVLRLYTSMARCLRVLLSEVNGLDDGMKTLYMHMAYMSLPVGYVIDSEIFLRDFALEPRGVKRSSVAVFGDPHLMVYKKGDVTCGAPGGVTYLRNKFMTIDGVNTPAFPGSQATYMTGTSIVFRNKEGELLAHYGTNNSSLSKEFDHGESTVSEGTPDEIRIEELRSNMIRIVYTTSGTTIILVEFRSTLTMVVRAADNLLDESVGLLIEGCHDDQINISESAPRPQRSPRLRRSASVCDDVDEDFRQQCEFDYTVTGDEELAKSVNVVVEATEKTVELDDVLINDDLKTTTPQPQTTETTTDSSVQIIVSPTGLILTFGLLCLNQVL